MKKKNKQESYNVLVCVFLIQNTIELNPAK